MLRWLLKTYHQKEIFKGFLDIILSRISNKYTIIWRCLNLTYSGRRRRQSEDLEIAPVSTKMTSAMHFLIHAPNTSLRNAFN
jgi:hypothetical protein